MSIEIDQYSVAEKPIELRFDETPLAIATAFVWRHGSGDYLVTNWHNVTGINPDDGTHLSATGGEPNRLVGLGGRATEPDDIAVARAG